MSDDPIDFSALDPRRRPLRWEAMVQRTLAATTVESIWSRLSPARVRTALAAVALLALLSWLPALLRSEATADPALGLVQYSHSGDVTALLESADGY